MSGKPLAPCVTFVDIRSELDNQLSRYQAWRDRNAAANPECHTLQTLDRYVDIYRVLWMLVARVSGDDLILKRLKEIARAERYAGHDDGGDINAISELRSPAHR